MGATKNSMYTREERDSLEPYIHICNFFLLNQTFYNDCASEQDQKFDSVECPSCLFKSVQLCIIPHVILTHN